MYCLRLYLLSYFWPRIHAGISHDIYSSCLFEPFLAVRISQTCVWWPGLFLRNNSKIFCRIFFTGICHLFFFLIIIQGLWAVGNKTTEVQCHFLITWYEGTVLSIWLTTAGMNLNHLAEVEFVRVLPSHMVLFCLSFHTVLFRRKLL